MRNFIILFFLLLFTGCIENDSNSANTTTNTNIFVGYLVDDNVSGVEYKCGNISGITGDQKDEFGIYLPGSFQFREDCTVEFNVGKIYLGSFSGSEILENKDLVKDNKIFVFPTNLAGVSIVDTDNPKVVNILRFLQSLDNDDNVQNGIEINSSIRDNLKHYDVPGLDLTQSNISEENLTIIINKADGNKTLIDETKAIAQFERTIRREVHNEIDTVPPWRPYVVNDFIVVNTSIAYQDVEIQGEAGSKIFLGYNLDGNESNVTLIDQNLTITDDGNQTLRLACNNDDITHFYYYIMFQDADDQNSTIRPVTIYKDEVPPYIPATNIVVDVKEGIEFVQEVNASDGSGYVFYDIVTDPEISPHADLFVVNSVGELRFKDGRDFETLDDNVKEFKYIVVARATDPAGNLTEVEVTVQLVNTLDSKPQLTSTDYNVSIHEMYEPNKEFFNLTTTVDSNFSMYPDNNLSAFYYGIVSDPTGKFEVERDTGIVKIKNGQFFDFESFDNFLTIDSRTIDLNVSVENENNSSEGNVSYATLSVVIENVIDTTPKIVAPSESITILEQNTEYTNQIPLVNNIAIDYNNSDRDTSTTQFYFYYNNAAASTSEDGNFTIDSQFGSIYNIAKPGFDYETTQEYNLTVRARTDYDPNVDGDYNPENNKVPHWSDPIVINIKVQNVLDAKPIIVLNEAESNRSVKESIFEDSNASAVIAKIDTNGVNDDENNVTVGYEIYEIYKGLEELHKNDYPFLINDNGEVKASQSLLENNIYIENNNNDDTIYQIKVRAKSIGWVDYENPNAELVSDPIQTIEINVTNVIDNPPVLEIPANTLTFEENDAVPTPSNGTPLGTTIYQINTAGSTIDENNVTKYTWATDNDSDNNETFIINETTGEITLKKLFDWESKPSYILKLVGINVDYAGNEQNSSVITLNIDINNTIEKTPRIKPIDDIYIHENISDGIVIKFVDIDSNATTDEQSINNFSISSGNDGNFTIELTNDENSSYAKLLIANNNGLDYEDKLARDGNDSYNLELNLTNEYDSSIENVKVIIKDDVEADIPLLAILVDFNDTSFSSSIADIDNNVYKKLNKYLLKVSKNNFSFVEATESFGDIISTGKPNDGIVKVSVAFPHPGESDFIQHRTELALNAADAFVDFSQYDTKNVDGNISKEELQILVIFAEDATKNLNPDYEGTNSFSHKVTLDGVNIAYESASGNFVAIGELANNETITIGIIAKTLSEKLFGFIKGGTDFKFEEYGLMHDGYGGFEGTDTIGTRPVHPSVYNKTLQGWVTPLILAKGTHEVEFVNTHNDQNKFNTVRINTDDDNVYYLIENRNYTLDNADASNFNYDNGLKKLLGDDFDGGLVIWKVDETTNDESVNIVPIANSTHNVFRPDNTNDDLPSDVRSVFEFVYELGASGSIEGDSLEDGSKTYTIKIEVK